MLGQGKKIVGVIPARMQSSRFYGKPLAKILGKEMVHWVYDICKGCKNLTDVYVATDHEEIRLFCESKSINYMMTDPAHRNCSERSNEVGQRVQADFVVEIQGDEPTLLPRDVDEFIDEAFKHSSFDIVTQYADITSQEAQLPNNVKVVATKEHKALFFSRSVLPFDFKSKNPRYYKQVGLYLWPAKALARFARTPVSYLESIEDTHMLRMIENGFDVRLVHTAGKSVGVDLPEHVAQAEAFLKQREASGITV